MRQKRWILFILVMIAAGTIISGCKEEEKSVEKLRDLEFTVVEDADLPKELKEMIDEKKQELFKLSYSNGEYLYIVYGYGEQQTGGYSIKAEALYETENAIYIDTTLIGPSKEESVSTALSYPYLVVKTELLDKNVVFE